MARLAQSGLEPLSAEQQIFGANHADKSAVI